MRNFVNSGEILTLTAPYAVSSGGGVKVGGIIAIATGDVASGAAGEFLTEGQFDVAKNSAEAWTVGAAIYWDDTAKVFTTVTTSNTKAGVATDVAANPSAVGRMRLNGSF